MPRNIVVFVGGLILASAAWAQEGKPPAGAPDMSKMGPMTRVVKHAPQDQKELAKFWKDWEAAVKKGDVATMADMVDFPVTMMTDDAHGNFESQQWNREQWVEVMKPFMDPAKMKDMKMTHKGTCHLMSDDLASCESDNAMEMGKMKGKFASHSVMTRKNGTWKIKTMMEAGWGGMGPPPKS